MIDAERLPWLYSEERGRLAAWSTYVEGFEDINSVIELTLTEARSATRADGGTVYLVTPEGRLRFAYFQNDTLSNGTNTSRGHYINAEIPLSEKSISGYAAITKQTLNITDVAEIPSNAPYSFNRTFDDSSGYRTVSLLTVPVIGREELSVAVLQLVNSLDEKGHPQPFGKNEVIYAEQLAEKSVSYISRSLETLADLDALVSEREERKRFRRVGSFAAEIFESWAQRNGLSNADLMARKDKIRLAAMMQHVNKVTSSDALDVPNKDDSPLFASITKVADVLGAKGDRSFDSVLGELENESSDHIDKEIVRAAAAIGPTLAAISNRYGHGAPQGETKAHKAFIA